jgi:tripartite-type tricarboxylate transporter receptor subunit TctC
MSATGHTRDRPPNGAGHGTQRSEELKKQLAHHGSEVLALNAPEFGKFIDDEMEKWGKVVKLAGIKAQ